MKKPILISAAMDVEYDFLKSKLDNVIQRNLYGYTVYEGEMFDYPVVILNTGAMEANAAIGIAVAVQNYNPECIINEGVAGGHGLNVHKGDIVIGENVVNIFSCDTKHKKRYEGSNCLEWKLTSFIPGEPNRLIYLKSDERLMNIAKEVEYLEGKVHVGTIGSGDVWDKEYDRIAMLNEKYGTLCEDMEACGIYTAAEKLNVPVLSIKIISNNEMLEEQYERSTGLKSQEFTYELIKKIVEDMK